MFCIHCGKKNIDDAKFCYYCGASMTVTNSSGDIHVSPGQIPSSPPQPLQQSPQIPIQDVYRVPVYNQSFSTLHPNIPGIVFSVLLIICCILPFVSIKYLDNSISFVSVKPGVGVLVLLGALTALVFSILNKRVGIFIPGLGGIAAIVIQFVYWISSMDDLFGSKAKSRDLMSLIGDFFEFGIGFWGVIICSIALIICGAKPERHYYGEDDETETNEYISKLRNENNPKGGWTCFVCGTKNDMCVGTCKCGNNISDARNKVDRSNPVPKITAKCPSCGRITKGNQTSCSECGSPFIR